MTLAPGLDMTQRMQTVRATASAVTCQGPQSDVAAASLSFEGAGKGACVPDNGVPSGQAEGTATWITAAQDVPASTVRGNFSLTSEGWRLDAVVVDGTFKGKRLQASSTHSPDSIQAIGQCFADGLKEVKGTLGTLNVS
ncbi:hypothetical protein OG696_40480 [Streptomyces sp. NBC_00656]|uniref:hypothetical protein n=1 Tax=Streptomyces sp. NBC_00656 TaxID=2903668 RepID=UPI003254923B